jgi:hypothetical protein
MSEPMLQRSARTEKIANLLYTWLEDAIEFFSSLNARVERGLRPTRFGLVAHAHSWQTG